MVWPALAAAGISGALGIAGQRSAEKARDRALKHAIETRRRLLREQRVSGARALRELEGARRDIVTGFNRARDTFGGAFRSAEIDTMDRQRQLMSSVERDLINSGRWSSNSLTMARMGVSASGSRVLADISSRAAAALADLEVKRGGAMAATRGAVAGQINRNFDQRSELARETSDIGLLDEPAAYDYSDPIGALFGAVESLFAPKAMAADPNAPLTTLGGAQHGGGAYQGPSDSIPQGGGGSYSRMSPYQGLGAVDSAVDEGLRFRTRRGA
jgi:hypothetical protein